MKLSCSLFVCRLHHFGEGDKIPHHKYGIYSKEWPKEREKVIRHVQRRRLENQGHCSRAKSVIESPIRRDNLLPPDTLVHSSINTKRSALKSSHNNQKPLLVLDKDDENKRISKLLGKIQKNTQILNRSGKPLDAKDIYRIQDLSNQSYQTEPFSTGNRLKSKRLVNSSKYKESLEFDSGSQDRRPESSKQKRFVITVSF